MEDVKFFGELNLKNGARKHGNGTVPPPNIARFSINMWCTHTFCCSLERGEEKRNFMQRWEIVSQGIHKKLNMSY